MSASSSSILQIYQKYEKEITRLRKQQQLLVQRHLRALDERKINALRAKIIEK